MALPDMNSSCYVCSRIGERFGITCNDMPHCMGDDRELLCLGGWFSLPECARVGRYLIERPVHFARKFFAGSGELVDVLSEVLRAVKLDGALFYNAEFSAPWAAHSIDARTVTSYLSPNSQHVIIFHLMT